jgi:hypothetical protein
MSEQMTKADRDALIRLVKARARQAKLETETREKILLAEVEDQITAEFSKRDELWADAVTIAEEMARKANEQIAARCADLGIPASQTPSLATGWMARSRSFDDPKRRAELRKLAQAKLAALTKQAKTAIDGKALDVETALLVGGLASAEARELVAAIPTAEQLIPVLGLADIGVKGWQPAEDAAGQLLTPLTPADRKRRRILRAIEANPDASDRRIAELAGCDHKTVAAYRRERGELPGRFPSSSGHGGEFPRESTSDGG